MNRLSLLLIKACKKLSINKLVYKLTDFFVSNRKTQLRSSDSRKELCSYYEPKETEIFQHNSIHKADYDLQIVVPVYNVEKYLEKCIESVLNQKTKYKYCVYIINDGSTDNSEKILDKYINIGNVYIINQRNAGLAAARNTGIKDIYANYLMFIDSDDYITENSVESLLNIAYSNNADIVEGSFVSFNDKKEIKNIRRTEKICEQELSGFAWGKIFRSALFNDFVFPSGYIYEDTMLYFMIYPKANIIYTVSDIVYRHLVNSNGLAMSSVGNKKSIDSYWLTEILNDKRAMLNYPNDKAYLIKLKKQFLINYSRTCLLPIAVQKNIFVLENDILRKGFDLCDIDDAFLVYIYNGKYYKYSNYAKWN